jgi:hypothetical protein
MKRFSLWPLAMITFVFLLALPEEGWTAAATAMQPGHMSWKRRVGPNANANCRHTRINICQSCHITMRMRVAQDRACPLNFAALGPFAGQQILVRPSHGMYGSANETATAYRPNPGFVGHDHFETRLFFEEGNGKRTFLNLNVNVFVAPTL